MRCHLLAWWSRRAPVCWHTISSPNKAEQAVHRRNLLGASAAAAGLALLGCRRTNPMTGSFLQPWRSHLQWTPEQWHARLLATRQLGISELFLQWSGIIGHDVSHTWQLPDAMLQQLLDVCEELGMRLHMGLPYDERWWKAIAYAPGTTQAAGPGTAAFLQSIQASGSLYMQRSRWPVHPAFAGWYIPYEIEQYHWASTQRVDTLSRALQKWSATALATSGRVPSISTYFSQLPTPGRLEQLWVQLLDQIQLHPMIQDGVGVAGLRNYAALSPLRDTLLQRQAPFDLIVELFEQLPTTQTDGSDFRAQSASAQRLQMQWAVAQRYGAQRVVAFAVDPWVLDDTTRARHLRTRWPMA